MVLEFLSLRRRGAEERTAGRKQVGARVIKHLVDQEIFLLGSRRGGDPGDVFVTEELEDAAGLFIQCLHRLEQRCFSVEGLAGPRDERRRNAERRAVGIPHEKSRTGHIPRSVAARGVRGADAAGGEGRGIGLALDEGLAFELRHVGAAVRTRIVKRIVLLGRGAGQRIEHVGKVRGPAADRPIFHGLGHLVRHPFGQFGPVLHRLNHRLISGRLEGFLHHSKTEGVGAEDGFGRFLHEVDGRVLRFTGGDRGNGRGTG